jgi:hypothetical protein
MRDVSRSALSGHAGVRRGRRQSTIQGRWWVSLNVAYRPMAEAIA